MVAILCTGGSCHFIVVFLSTCCLNTGTLEIHGLAKCWKYMEWPILYIIKRGTAEGRRPLFSIIYYLGHSMYSQHLANPCISAFPVIRQHVDIIKNSNIILLFCEIIAKTRNMGLARNHILAIMCYEFRSRNLLRELGSGRNFACA